MAYYAVNGTRIDTSIIIAKHTAAAINARFKGATMNVMTNLDALPITAGFEAYTSYEMTGYKWGGTQLNYVRMNSLKRNINNCSTVTFATTSGTTFSNTLSYPKVYYVMFQAAGGKGGTQTNGTACGGGSGSYTISKVVLQPNSSFKLTHYATYAKCELVTGAAYINGSVSTAGYSFSITASAGTAGTGNTAGAGFRSGGEEERDGIGIAMFELVCDGYACPPYAILGGKRGIDRYTSSVPTNQGRGAGGGGASAGPYLRNYGAGKNTGGGGAFYYKDTYNTHSLPAQSGFYGGGSGGGMGPNPGAAACVACSLIFH